MKNDDFKYIIQDTGNIYFGRELTYAEMMERDDMPFKFKAIINVYISRETDLNKKMSAHLLEIDTDDFCYRIFEQLKLTVRVCFREETRNFSGKKKEKWVHKICSVKQFCAEYRDKVKAQEMFIEDVSISKFSLMIISV